MNSPAFAIAYGIWARNRHGFLLCAAGLAAMALFYPLLFAYSRRLGNADCEHDSADRHFQLRAQRRRFSPRSRAAWLRAIRGTCWCCR